MESGEIAYHSFTGKEPKAITNIIKGDRMSKENKDFLKYSQRFWSEKYGRELSIEETKEIIHNLTGYFKVLIDWNSQNKK